MKLFKNSMALLKARHLRISFCRSDGMHASKANAVSENSIVFRQESFEFVTHGILPNVSKQTDAEQLITKNALSRRCIRRLLKVFY